MEENVLNLNDQQIKAVNFGDGPLLIIAGAGTGKTTVITQRIKHLILDKKINPSEILSLTFTEKAAREMEERIDMAMPYGYSQMWIYTFHSFCDRILKQEAIHIGLDPSYRLLTQAETILFLRKNIFKFNLNYFRPLGNPDKFLESLLQHFSRLKDEDINEKEYLAYAKRNSRKKQNVETGVLTPENIQELSLAFKTYEQLKQTQSVMDFADLISNTLKLFRTRKNILEQYQKQFKHILIDEFQDTNFAQNELAILLAGKKQNITLVGDDDQSIYRFRGSSISNIIQFRQRFNKTQIITLTKNYRSTGKILDGSYSLIQYNNPDRLEIKEKINKKLESARELKGDNIEFIFSKNAQLEAQDVAEKISSLCKDKHVDYKDIAILVRANDHAQSFIQALNRIGIPYQFSGPGRLFNQEEIKDLIAYLRVIVNFTDSVSLYRIFSMSIFAFEVVEITWLLNLARRKNYTLFESLDKIDETPLRQETKDKFKQIKKMIIRHLTLSQKTSAGQILYYFLKDSMMLDQLLKYKSGEENKAKNISVFFDLLKNYETEHDTSLTSDVVDWIDLSIKLGEGPSITDFDLSDRNAVNISTIHASKGLEFKIVFLVNLVTQRFPTVNRHEALPLPQDLIKEILPQGDYHLQEERRLFYVGMTRAEDKLFLTASSLYSQAKRQRKISPFVYETLGEETVKKIEKQNNKETVKQLTLLEFTPPVEKPKPAGLPAIEPVVYLSYSMLQTFDICPLHYKLRYILKIPTFPSASQSFGTSIHSSLKNIYSLMKTEDVTENKALELLKKSWINEGYTSSLHEKQAWEKAKKILLTHLSRINKTHLPIALEYPFKFRVNDITIAGRIDRIDQKGKDHIEIIDYKTGNNLPDQKQLDSNIQLTIYALAANNIQDTVFNNRNQQIDLSLLYLEHDKKFTTTRNIKQLKQAKETLIQKAKDIQLSDFLCSKSILCKNCEYKMLCQSS